MKKTFCQQLAIYLSLSIERHDRGRRQLWNIRLLSLTPLLATLRRLIDLWRSPTPASVGVWLTLLEIGLSALLWGLRPTGAGGSF